MKSAWCERKVSSSLKGVGGVAPCRTAPSKTRLRLRWRWLGLRPVLGPTGSGVVALLGRVVSPSRLARLGNPQVIEVLERSLPPVL